MDIIVLGIQTSLKKQPFEVMACLLLFIRTSTAEGQQIFADKGVAATDMAYAYLNLGLEGWGKGKPILWSENMLSDLPLRKL